MTRKTKKVRCWMVTLRENGQIVYRSICLNRQECESICKPGFGDTITPGHFVPDEPTKRKARRK